MAKARPRDRTYFIFNTPRAWICVKHTERKLLNILSIRKQNASKYYLFRFSDKFNADFENIWKYYRVQLSFTNNYSIYRNDFVFVYIMFINSKGYFGKIDLTNWHNYPLTYVSVYHWYKQRTVVNTTDPMKTALLSTKRFPMPHSVNFCSYNNNYVNSNN